MIPGSNKILVTGANGQLGMEFRSLEKLYPQHSFVFAGRDDLPIDNLHAVEEFFDSVRPSHCINCAAYTAVDKAESEKAQAFEANATSVEYLAKFSQRHQAKLIHFSTDYVFAGNGTKPYTPEEPTHPLNYYGYSKEQGELKAMRANVNSLIIRTSWVYSRFGKNFVKTMVRLMSERETLGVVNDQFGSPTYAADLADAVMQIIDRGRFTPGIFHYCNKGIISWYDFAVAIRELLHSSCKVEPIPTNKFPTPAKRPAYSALDLKKFERAFQVEIPHWYDSLKMCMEMLRNENASAQ